MKRSPIRPKTIKGDFPSGRDIKTERSDYGKAVYIELFGYGQKIGLHLTKRKARKLAMNILLLCE